MKIKAFITHKLEERYADCADSFAVNSDCKRIAISDGVSQSFSPQDWAKLLVRAFVEKHYTPEENAEQLLYLQDMWRKLVLQNLKKLEEAGEVTWMMENCIEDKESAGATFCGVELQDDIFHCWVLGDSALVTISNQFEYKLYSTQDGEFNNRPDFLDSYGAHIGTFREYNIPKDNLAYILLVTDPFSDLLHQCNNNTTAKEILKKLINVQTHDEFCIVVDDLRANYSMHNDDSTFVSIQLDKSNRFEIVAHTDIESHIQEESQNNTDATCANQQEEDNEQQEQEVKPFNPAEIIKKTAEKKRLSKASATTPESKSESEETPAIGPESTSKESEGTILEAEIVHAEPATEQKEKKITLEGSEPTETASTLKSIEKYQNVVEATHSDDKTNYTYEEFIASSKEAYTATCDLIESKPLWKRLFTQKLSSSEFEELWHAIADKLYRR